MGVRNQVMSSVTLTLDMSGIHTPQAQFLLFFRHLVDLLRLFWDIGTNI